MYSQDFCFWLQGFFELSQTTQLNETQTTIIKNHLNLVFQHEIDPQHNSQTNIPPQQLQTIHDGSKHTPHHKI